MGICLFPADGNNDSPDACFSYGGFHRFRTCLAMVEGIELGKMVGFGGELSWDEVSSPLKPILNFPDDGVPTFSVEQCRPILARLKAIQESWPLHKLMIAESMEFERGEASEVDRGLHNLIAVIDICVEKRVDLFTI